MLIKIDICIYIRKKKKKKKIEFWPKQSLFKYNTNKYHWTYLYYFCFVIMEMYLITTRVYGVLKKLHLYKFKHVNSIFS